MNLKKLKGTGVALVTPFHKDGSIDFRSLEKVVSHVIKGQAEYLVVLGTTGESVTISKDEKAVGKTIALADPNPISTAEICDAVSEALINKKSVIVPPMSLVEFSLSLPMSPMISGLPHSGVPYFFLSQTYDTSVSEKLLAEHGITCPTFPTYVKNLIKFMETHPKL